jgi:hypothetical protein
VDSDAPGDGWPDAQMEAGVMIRSDGWVVSHALLTMLVANVIIIRKHFARERRENMAGFYQFLLQSLLPERKN